MVYINNLYRVPWTKNDYPNGWVEVTELCNMACPGCYRGCNIKNNSQKHKPLEKIKEEILLSKKIKNCQAILLSGGEPLLHPKILDIIKFIKENKMSSVLLTNGLLLNKKLIFELKKAGLDFLQLSIKDDTKTEKDLRDLRESYLNMIKNIGGIGVGFMYVVDTSNLKELRKMMEWVRKYPKEIHVLCVNIKRQIFFSLEEKIDPTCQLDLEELINEISLIFPGIKYSFYIGSLAKDIDIKWIGAFQLYFANELIGYPGGKLMEYIQTSFHYKNGTYIYFKDKKDFSLSSLKLILLLLKTKENKILRKVIKKIFFNPINIFSKGIIQYFVLHNPPRFVDGKRDFCDAGVCCTIHNGKITPSCVLEEIKKFGRPVELKDFKK